MGIKSGTEILVRAEGETVKGKLVEERPERFVLFDEKAGLVLHVPKNKITWFAVPQGSEYLTLPETQPAAPAEEDERREEVSKPLPQSSSGLHLLARIDKQGRETGVYFLANAERMKESVSLFRRTCRIEKKVHDVGDLGDVFEIPSERLVEIMSGLVIETEGDE